MNNNEKAAEALNRVLSTEATVRQLEGELEALQTTRLPGARRAHETAAADAVRVLKSLGKQQAIFRGILFDVSDDTFHQQPFDGLLLE